MHIFVVSVLDIVYAKNIFFFKEHNVPLRSEKKYMKLINDVNNINNIEQRC